jgi:hypothetical protein
VSPKSGWLCGVTDMWRLDVASLNHGWGSDSGDICASGNS